MKCGQALGWGLRQPGVFGDSNVRVSVSLGVPEVGEIVHPEPSLTLTDNNSHLRRRCCQHGVELHQLAQGALGGDFRHLIKSVGCALHDLLSSHIDSLRYAVPASLIEANIARPVAEEWCV